MAAKKPAKKTPKPPVKKPVKKSPPPKAAPRVAPKTATKAPAPAAAKGPLLETQLLSTTGVPDRELLIKAGKIFKQHAGSGHLNLFNKSEGSWELSGVAHRDQAILLDGPVADSSFLKNLPQSAGLLEDTAGLYLLENEKALPFTEEGASVIVAPAFLSTGQAAGAILFISSKEDGRFNQSDIKTAEKVAAILSPVLLRIHAARQEASAKKTLLETKNELKAQKKAFSDLEAESAKSLNEKTELLEKTTKEAEANLLSLKREKNVEIQKMQEEWRAEKAAAIAQAVQELEAKSAELSAKLEETTADLSAKLEETRADLGAKLEEEEKKSAKIESARSELETRSRDLAAQLEKSQEENLNLSVDLEQLQKDRELQLQNTKTTLEKEFQDKIKSLEENARSLSEKNQSLSSSLENVKKNLESIQSELEKEKSERKKETDQLSAEKKNLTDRLGNSSSQEESLRRNISELEAKKSGLEKELSALRETSASVQKELEETRSRFDSFEKDSARQTQELRASGEKLSSEKNSLEKELEQLRAYAQELEKENESASKKAAEVEAFLGDSSKKSQEQIRLLQNELTEARKNLEQKETNLLQEVYTLKQDLNQAAGSAEQQKRDFLDRISRIEKENAEKLSSAEKVSQELREKTAQAEKETAAAAAKLSDFEARYRELESRREEQENAAGVLRKERDDSIRRYGELEQTLASERSRFEQEKVKARQEEDAFRLRTSEEASRLQKTISELNEKIQQIENNNASQLREINVLKNQNDRLAGSVAELTDTKAALENRLAENDRIIQDLQKELQTRDSRLKALTEDLQKSRDSENQLKNEISISREREVKLEQAAASLESEIHRLKGRIASHEETIGALRKTGADLEKNIKNLKTDLTEAAAREKKLGEELASATQREKGSRREGHLLARAADTISNAPTFADKIRGFTSSLPGENPIARSVVYALIGDELLEVVEAVQGETRLDGVIGKRVTIRESQFGQTIASADIQPLPDTKEGSPDIQATGVEKIAAHFVCIPLIESEKITGIITMASPKKFSEDSIRFLKAVSPILAIALKFERIFSELRHYRTNINHYDDIGSFLQYRSIKTARELSGLVSRLQESIASGESASQTDLAGRLKTYLETPLPRFEEKSDLVVMLDSFVSDLGEMARDRTGLEFSKSLPDDMMQMLHERTGRSMRNLFWLTGEAVENVVRHSQATKMEISLKEENGSIVYSIWDNGEGIVRTAGTEKPEKGMGLKAIRSLAYASGAQALFERGPGGYGLVVRIIWKQDR